MLQSSSHEQVASRSCPLIQSFPHGSRAKGSDSKKNGGMAHAAQGAWKWDDDTSVTGVTDGKEGAQGRKVRLETHPPRTHCTKETTCA